MGLLCQPVFNCCQLSITIPIGPINGDYNCWDGFQSIGNCDNHYSTMEVLHVHCTYITVICTFHLLVLKYRISIDDLIILSSVLDLHYLPYDCPQYICAIWIAFNFSINIWQLPSFHCNLIIITISFSDFDIHIFNKLRNFYIL